MRREDYLRSRQRRGRWFHYYRRDGREIPLGVHGLHPTDPRVFAAYCGEHARWEHRPPETKTPKSGTFAWAVDLLMASKKWEALADSTKQNREAILRRYVKTQGARPLHTITGDAIDAALYAKGGHAAVNELKALKMVFAHAKRSRFLAKDPTVGLKMERPATEGFPTASADEIEKFQKRWPIGTTERLVFDLALYTGAARVDLAKLSRKNLEDGLLNYTRQKTGVECDVPLTPELRAVIARTPDIAPAFLLTSFGKPFAAAGLGNFFADACKAAGVEFRLHGLRKAFCVYWAEKEKTPHQIAAMAGHLSLSEVVRYTKAADRRRMVKLIVAGA
ncbi:tyrosine-type recombinase/integrase [Mangrovicoccus sp. HB161399]|uniref:tyrosine-type recombinase/integrase n=1 Tax=Mangrovicoccus sp. HB161399 TaxID=2720392 RepID=UPI0015529C6F|nr:tyrosine-type recombinase/integrase [Mangrovicoccus sp. HB161399]